MIDRVVLNSVVPIGIRVVSGMGMPLQIAWIGTGFFIAKADDGLKDRIYLVTNKHVLQGAIGLVIRVVTNTASIMCSDIDIPLLDPSGNKLYAPHPSPLVDIAAISVENAVIKTSGLGFKGDMDCLLIKDMKAIGLGEGDIVYSLGYPMRLVDNKHCYPICRMGCISRICSAYDGLNPIEYIVDAQVFPGNSGGPIITKVSNGIDTVLWKLIGVLSGYIPYQETLVSQQTQKPRSTMEENSGLTVVFPYDRIEDVIRLESARIGLSEKCKSVNL